ncbi:MarR family transcriptional regulator [Paracoccus sp. MBLB3053]|uniref:MarR family transcriptional regulator n=1 Tax=Paracoccus aurantius TaxID=3073814 RepID=A0ABU2HTW6_9RHOB|nr:MarR family transcriptional regulator [Paracoccus sp. MBLB3053]MDS9468478.1 MarR family transcriptional regulator [Paracoccus sp. MBLB3053]
MSTQARDDSLVHVLMELNRQLVRQLSGDGLPVEQWRVLSLLHANPDGMTMRALGEGLSIAAPSMTKLIDRMVNEALVYRVPNPSDRRNVVILASDKGKALRDEADGRMGKYEERLSSEFQPDDIAKLQAMLGRLLVKP